MSNKINSGIGLAIIISIGVFLIIRNYRDSKLLLNYNKTIGILIEIEEGKGVHQTAYGKFKYNEKNNEISFTQSGDFSFMKLGDTVLIRYDKENNKVAEVLDKYYMKKYKKLKKR